MARVEFAARGAPRRAGGGASGPSARARAEGSPARLFWSEPARAQATRILDACVASVDAAAEARRWPVRVPSRRVALGCYARALDALADESCDVSTGYEVYGDCRRSRLLDIFRELKDEGGAVGIYGLEGGIASK